MWRPDEDLEIGACFKIATIRVNSGPPPPSGSRNSQNLRFPRKIGHLPPILLVGGRGGVCEKVLHSRVFLAFRQSPVLAEGPTNNCGAADPVSLSRIERCRYSWHFAKKPAIIWNLSGR